MKKLIVVLLSVLSFTAHATTYYFAASGNDANNGTSTSTPWKTLSKFNSVFASKVPGDNFLFNRGDVFYGSITISRSGSSGSPITISAYGTGANPVITGLTTVGTWTNLGSNIWESTSSVSGLSKTNMVVINGVNTPMGRYPNTGYLTYQSFAGNTKITSSSLTGSTNWTGAEAVIRKQRWIIDRNVITAQSGSTITYTPSSGYNGQNNYGFFIQNDSRTLDQQNEWYYSPSTKKIRVYSTSTPAKVQLSTLDILVTVNQKGYITFDNITFSGADKNAFYIVGSNNITIQNCTIDYSGQDAIFGFQNVGRASSSFVVKNSTINHTNNNAINLASEFAGALISHNTIKNTGVIVGMGGSGDGTYEAVQTAANNVITEYNEIDSTGYIGIYFTNNSTIIRNNFLNGFCLVKLDGAGIYTWNSGTVYYTGQQIINNIAINGIGNNAGTNATGAPLAHGIYLDGGSANMIITGNSIANCSHDGLYIHNSHALTIRNNTSYNNGNHQALFVSFDAKNPIRNALVKNNIFVSKDASQLVGSFQSSIDDIRSFGTLDSNYWARPMDDNLILDNDINNYASIVIRTLAQWQSYSAQDAHSHKAPKTITTVNDLRFEYNPTTSNKTVSLDGNYIDMKNVSYNGSITLAPYTSAVLIRNGASTNKAPTANAGSNQTITLPTSTVTLTGSGTDPDGTIKLYSWTKISGTGGVITSPSSAQTAVTGLTQGSYQFQLTVTDNVGATGVASVQVTVNASGGTLLPAVNPANTVNGLDYKYYQATSFSTVPIFSSLTPVKTGSSTTTFDISKANRTYAYAFNFTGYISVPSDGQYTFYTTSDDGSNLYIDNVLVVNNDGLHAATEKSGTIGLKAGKHAISVGFFQQGGIGSLSTSYSGPGVSKQAIPASALYRVSSSGFAADMEQLNSISNEQKVGISAYPNPFTNYIEINITGGAAGEYKLILIDASGRTVWTKTGVKNTGAFQQTVNTTTLERGVYFLKVIQNNTSSVVKLVK